MPIDSRIALGVQPFQLADPLAQYGQVQNILAAQSQRQAAGTSNELAQVQLGQAQMTMRRAQEAQDFIDKTMEAAAKNNAPTKDPMEAAMIMSNHPNEMVRTVGKHMLEANKIVQEYRQQSQFMQDQSPAAAAAQPEAAAPAAFQYEESPAFGAQARTAPVDSSPAASMPVVRGMQTNALASATAPQVNALAAPQGKTAQSIAAEISQKDRQYGTAPGWLKQRELMVLQYKEALDPRHATFAAINPKDFTQESIAKFNQTKNYADLVEKIDLKNKNLGNVNPADYTPDSVQKFAASGNYSDLILKPTKADNLIGNVTPADYTSDSLAKFAISKDYADLVLKPAKVDNKTISNVNPDSYTPDSVAKFAKSSNYADLVLRPSKTDKTIGNVSPADYTPKSVAKFNVSGDYADLVPKAPVSSATPAAPVAVVGADGKIKYVSREEAISKGMTPASAEEGLTTKEKQVREAKYPVAKQSVTTVSATMNQIDATVKRLLENEKGLNGITGLVYGNTPALTDAARRAAADLKQLKNLAFVQGLTELRNASSTGAAVGNVTNKEGDRFENLKASLETSQSFDDLKASLARLQSQARATRDTVKQTFEDTYSYRNNTPAASGAVDTSNPLLKGK
jgi:hypothetical protein